MINLFFDSDVQNPHNITKNLSEHPVMNLSKSLIQEDLKTLEVPHSLKQIGVDIPVDGEKNIYPVEHFWPKSGNSGLSSLFDVIPEYTKYLLRSNKIDMLVYFPYEGFDLTIENWSNNLELSLKNNNLENANKTLMFGNLDVESLYAKTKYNNFWNKTLGIDYWQYRYANEYKQRVYVDNCEKEIKIEEIFRYKHKDFLCFNGTMRPPRILFHSELKRNNLDQHGYISALERNFNQSHFNTALDYIKNNPEKSQHLKAYSKNWEPCILDVTTRNLIRDDRKKNENLYLDSYYSVVTDCDCVQDGIFVTEKTFKPIVNLHPFIILGSTTSFLEYLREQGYYTFPELFNEDYDYEADIEKRIEMILENISQFSKLSTKEKDHKLKSIKPKLLHNRELFLDNNNKNVRNLRKAFQQL